MALNDRTSLNQLVHALREALLEQGVDYQKAPSYQAERMGDMRHSQADISKAKTYLGYEPEYRIREGLKKAMPWYLERV